ncbi:hypothetical protein BDK51DRAFT_47633 [Blyttiomyces helicus]|uniref:Uncharacterized protein n=1 Tax=Blyttiomyces helicus TaxID=388810 RepID=A0A4P9WIV8_9FUNG|nr:hypothetical protein BDK51DRAFT_47633 [Blyttiomyces helicus]|eukprot:RKO90516.1 hypothetical protein BDK51DRAFT_47633 [Blyttiomyces helicus]
MHLDLELEKTATLADVAAIERRMAEMYPNKSIEERTRLAEDYVNIASVDFDEGFAQNTLQLVHATLLTFLKRAFPQCYGRNNSGYSQGVPVPHYLSACRPNKLSFHVVVPQLIFDQHNTSVAFTVWEFHQFLQYTLVKMLHSTLPPESRLVVLQCMNLHKTLELQQFIVDLAPNGKIQQFRILGAGKSGRAPFRHSGATSNGRLGRAQSHSARYCAVKIPGILLPASLMEFTQLLVVPDGIEPGLGQ